MAKLPASASLVLGKGNSKIKRRQIVLLNYLNHLTLSKTYLASLTESFHALTTAAVLHNETLSWSWIGRAMAHRALVVLIVLPESLDHVLVDVVLLGEELVWGALVVCIYLPKRCACWLQRCSLQS